MLRNVVAAMALLGFAVVLSAGAMAAEEKKEEKKTETVKGTLSVTKSEDGKKTTYALKVGDVVYTLVGKKDAVKDLAALDKKEVEVTGVVKEKDGKKSLYVASFKEVTGDAPKADAPKTDAPATETK